MEKTKEIPTKAGDIFYEATIQWNKSIKPGKTFFPDNWSPGKVAEKIEEAYMYCLKNGIRPKLNEKNGRFKFVGKLVIEDIDIEIIIDKNGKMISAYPLVSQLEI